MSAQDVAEFTIKALETDQFLILPHEEVAEYMRGKVADYDRWLGGMAKLQRSLNT